MSPKLLPYTVSSRVVNGMTLEVAEAGPIDGPLVVLLHGIPDIWEGWRFQIPALAASGFRVLAPNQRGYGRSSKPRSVMDYDEECLARDAVALAATEGRSHFHLVGHDWGGIVAFWTAARFPEQVSRLVVLNAPHPGIFKRYLLRHPRQLLRSWYVGAFQFPWIPELLLRVNDFSLMFRAIKATSPAGTFDASDCESLRRAWSEPGALTAMINYYRALARRREQPLRVRVTVPTLLLFGCLDPAEGPGLAEESLSLCDNGRVIWLPHAMHWIQREECDVVNQHLLGFLNSTE